MKNIQLREPSLLRRQEMRCDRQKNPRFLFLFLCLNLMVAPAVHAANGSDFSRLQSYALGILILVTVALSIYLFVVMFQPERF